MSNLLEQADMTKSNPRAHFELLRREEPNGVSPKGLPQRHEHWRYVGYVYVIEMSNGITKVGRTANPSKRMEQHLRQAGPFELKIARLWLSIAHRDPVQTEKLLLGYGRQHAASQVLDEYFKGLSFKATVRYASEVPFTPIDEDEIAETTKREQRPSLFFRPHELAAAAKLDSTPPDFADWARTLIGRLFGREADGSYPRAATMLTSGVSNASEAEDLWNTLLELADLRGCCLECILQKTPIDTLAGMISELVKTEALLLEQHARKHGHAHLLRSNEEIIRQALPADDPRFDTERDPSSDYWEYNPEVGYSLCTKQGDVLDIVDELPPGAVVGGPRGNAHTTDYLFAIEGGR